VNVTLSIERAQEQKRRGRLFSRIVRRRDLVSFASLADWYGRESADRRNWALQDLGAAAIRGEFGRNLFYLPTHLPTYRPFWIRRTGFQVAGMKVHGHDETGDLWAPRSLCAKWLATRGISFPPWVVAEAQLAATPRPPTPTTAVVRKARRSVPDEKVTGWYGHRAEHARSQGIKLNRKETIQRCQDELGCLRDAARKGFQTLPREVRNGRGRPKK
jgi:hypothetical protein